MKTVARALVVSRSNLIERLSGDTRTRGRYCKAKDADITAQVRRIVDQRPTYGYRRITGVLDNSFPVVNDRIVFKVIDEDIGEDNRGISIAIGYRLGGVMKYGLFGLLPEGGEP